MIDLYLKKVFSTRACWWYPDSFFHRRRPTFLTRLTVRGIAYAEVSPTTATFNLASPRLLVALLLLAPPILVDLLLRRRQS